MLAASYWSLLAPAVEMATSSGGFGAFAFFPVAVGFTFGAAFVYLADLLMPYLVSTTLLLAVVSGYSQLCAMDLFLIKPDIPLMSPLSSHRYLNREQGIRGTDW